MLCLDMPNSFQIGDTAACRINGEPNRVHWKTSDTLVLLGTSEDTPPDERAILIQLHDEHNPDGMRTFYCAAEREPVPDTGSASH